MTKYTEKQMLKLPLETVIQEYLGDMKLRNLSPLTIKLYADSLRRFYAFLISGQSQGVVVPVSALTLEAARGFVHARMNQTTLWQDHPNKQPATRSLSPYTIHQEVRILRAFGTWMKANQYPNNLKELKLPKLPKTMIETLSDDEV